jgi:hypothetical protein
MRGRLVLLPVAPVGRAARRIHGETSMSRKATAPTITVTLTGPGPSAFWPEPETQWPVAYAESKASLSRLAVLKENVQAGTPARIISGILGFLADLPSKRGEPPAPLRAARATISIQAIPDAVSCLLRANGFETVLAGVRRVMQFPESYAHTLMGTVEVSIEGLHQHSVFDEGVHAFFSKKENWPKCNLDRLSREALRLLAVDLDALKWELFTEHQQAGLGGAISNNGAHNRDTNRDREKCPDEAPASLKGRHARYRNLRTGTRTDIAAARKLCGENESRAQSLLKQFRRWGLPLE